MNPMSQNPPCPGVFRVFRVCLKDALYSLWDGNEWKINCVTTNDARTIKTRSGDAYNGKIVGWDYVPTEIYPLATGTIITSTVGATNTPSNRYPTAFNPMSQEPTEIGVYELEHQRFYNYSLWDGVQWCEASNDIYAARGKVPKSNGCYDGRVTGWRHIAGETYTPGQQTDKAFGFPKAKQPQEFEPDQVKPELMSKRIRDWV